MQNCLKTSQQCLGYPNTICVLVRHEEIKCLRQVFDCQVMGRLEVDDLVPRLSKVKKYWKMPEIIVPSSIFFFNFRVKCLHQVFDCQVMGRLEVDDSVWRLSKVKKYWKMPEIIVPSSIFFLIFESGAFQT
jgi:hypothetical protein